jgi:hypothetical protein
LQSAPFPLPVVRVAKQRFSSNRVENVIINATLLSSMPTTGQDIGLFYSVCIEGLMLNTSSFASRAQTSLDQACGAQTAPFPYIASYPEFLLAYVSLITKQTTVQ